MRACSPPDSRPDRQVELLGPEQEALGPRGDVDAPPLEDDRVALRRERAPQRLVGIERRRGPARSGRARRPSARSMAPASGASVAREQVEQRRLAAAVRTDDARRACPA